MDTQMGVIYSRKRFLAGFGELLNDVFYDRGKWKVLKLLSAA
jgi:hypothetical protein